MKKIDFVWSMKHHRSLFITNLLLQKFIYVMVKEADRLCDLVVKSSWLQIQRPWFDSRHYQIFLEVLSLARGPLSLVSII
jgi:hypothetical protein